MASFGMLSNFHKALNSSIRAPFGDYVYYCILAAIVIFVIGLVMKCTGTVDGYSTYLYFISFMCLLAAVLMATFNKIPRDHLSTGSLDGSYDPLLNSGTGIVLDGQAVNEQAAATPSGSYFAGHGVDGQAVGEQAAATPSGSYFAGHGVDGQAVGEDASAASSSAHFADHSVDGHPVNQ
ncbi:peptidase C13 [Babesia caballi]|uniref:Peptidase C13 n=1 Tax=Babesia caballi TaxID=5871 RepID=A0AAV4LM63_BABCB|nr:peptidase C13 [Babesia caballi]